MDPVRLHERARAASDQFSGRVFHSARWEHDHDLNGRRVAVVGTGASAIQFVPEIPRRWRALFRRSPRALELLRRTVFSLHKAVHFGFRDPKAMRLIEPRARDHIAREVGDPELRAKVTPDYSLGCKRILGSKTWYPALCQDNVDVVCDGIREVVADGIIDAAGVHHPTDTIILATGFQVSGFPNMFMLLGPNTGLGHNSVLLMIESQIAYVRQALAHRHRQGLATLEPTPAAQAEFLAHVDRDTEGSVWTAGGCLSWYVDATGRNSTLWPGSVRAYQRRVARFEPRDYTGELPHRETVRPASPCRPEPDVREGAPCHAPRSPSTAGRCSSQARHRASAGRSPGVWPTTAVRSRSPTRTRRGLSRPPS